MYRHLYFAQMAFKNNIIIKQLLNLNARGRDQQNTLSAKQYIYLIKWREVER